MGRIVSLGVGVLLALVFFVPSGAARAADVAITHDLGPPRYTVSIAPGCNVSIELDFASKANNFTGGMDLMRGGRCSPDVAQEMPALAAILDAVVKDGFPLKEFKTLALGNVGEPVWQHRIADCYAARYGMNDRLPHDLKGMEGCRIFRELDAPFAKHGVALAYDDMEEATYLDLAHRKDRQYALSFYPDWAQSLRESRGLVLTSAIVYLHIVPLKRVTGP